MTDADKKLYDKAEELFCQNCKLRTEQCLFAYRKVNGIEDCHKSCGCEEVPAWIDGYREGLKAKINATTISDCPIKEEWHYPAKGELPEKDNCLCIGYFGNDNYAICKVNRGRFWISSCGWLDFEDATAWRYIEPPKEEE